MENNSLVNNGSMNPFDCAKNKDKLITGEESMLEALKFINLKDDTYTIPIKCDNCGNEKYFTIPKGHTFRSYLKDIICVFCNCNVVKQRNKFIMGIDYSKTEDENVEK